MINKDNKIMLHNLTIEELSIYFNEKEQNFIIKHGTKNCFLKMMVSAKKLQEFADANMLDPAIQKKFKEEVIEKYANKVVLGRTQVIGHFGEIYRIANAGSWLLDKNCFVSTMTSKDVLNTRSLKYK